MTMVVCIVVRLVIMSSLVIVSGVCTKSVVYQLLLNVVCFLSQGACCVLLVCVMGVVHSV